MMVRYTLRAAALASTCLLPMAAQAADDAAPVHYANEIFVGGQYQSEKSAAFGRFTGQTDKGGTALGGFTVRGRDDVASGGTTYWELLGSDLGLTSRSVSAKYGEQGWWGVQVGYEGIVFNKTDTFHTIYDTSGKGTVPPNLSSVLVNNPANPYGLPQTNGTSTAVGATQAFNNLNQLTPYLNAQHIGTQRDILTASGKYLVPNSDWSVTTGLRHEHKEGTLENSVGFGALGHSNTNRACGLTSASSTTSATSTNGVPVGSVGCVPANGATDIVAFPEPVNYDTDRYDAQVAYNTQRLQGVLSYAFMNFTDNNTSFNAIDPLPLLNANANYAPYQARAAFGLPPSNSEHQIRTSLAYAITPSTRIVANLQYGFQQQNAGMPAATSNPSSIYTVTQLAQLASNPSGLKGTEQNYFGNVAITSRPISRLDLKASYTIDDRKDDTTTQLFYRSSFDAAALSAYTNTNPSSYTDQKAKLEAGYRILEDTKATVGYTFKQKNANNGQFGGTREDALSGKVHSDLTQNVEGSASYAHSNRYGLGTFYRGDAYGEYVYFEAPRVRDEVKTDLSFAPSRDVSVGFNGQFAADHYNEVPHGLTAATQAYLAQAPGLRNEHNINVGPDVTFKPSQTVSAHLFYNFERVFYDVGLVNSINPTSTSALGSTPYMNNKTTDDVHTVGVNGEWQASPKLKFGANYNFSYGNTTINVTDGATSAFVSGLNPNGTINSASNVFYGIQALPDVTSQLHTLSVHGEYQFQPNMSIWAGYTFERLIYSDWAYDYGSSNALFGNALVSGEANPSYAVHVVGVALRVKW